MKNYFPDTTSHLSFLACVLIPSVQTMHRFSSKVFDYESSSFQKWNTSGPPIGEVRALVYEQTKDGTFKEIFESLGKDLHLLRFERVEQIKVFVEKHRALLHPQWYTHFLVEDEEGKPHVVQIQSTSSGGLSVQVHAFSSPFMWRAFSGYRFVVPYR